MNISSSQINSYNTVISAYSSAAKVKDADASCTSKNRDTFEISNADYSEYTKSAQVQAEQPYAVSGNDALKITPKGNNGNKFVIHFYDSAQLARTVENGYIYVNDVRIDLPDNIKKSLISMDKAIQTSNQLSALSQTMRENMEAAQKQADATEEFFDKMNKAFEIANRISKGGKVPPADEQLLMDVNPSLYMISMIAAMMAKEHKKYDTLIEEKEQQQNSAPTEPIESISYEIRMNVSLNGAPSVESVSSAEIHK